MSTTLSLDSLILLGGSHRTREAGMCVMEAAAWMAGEPHSDKPECVDSMLAAFARRLNDAAWPTDEARTAALRPVLPLLVGTAGKMDRERLRWFFADAAIRDFAPRALDSAASVLDRRKFTEHAEKLRGHAKQLRELPAVTAENWRSAKAKAWEARCEARAAAAAAYAAAAADAAAAAAAAAADADAADAADAAYAAAAAAAAAAYAAAAARLELLKAAADVLRRACTECRAKESVA